MQKLVREYLNELNKKQKKRRKAGIATLLLIVLVVGAVIGVLTQYGVAMTGAAKCGIEEHQHNESCYQSVLVCSQAESEGHQHSEACYQTETTLVCGQEESEEHAHTDECYTTTENLVCGQEESAGHIHSDACYQSTLACGQEEHTHTQDCYIDTTADVEDASVWNAQYKDVEWKGVWSEDLVTAAQKQIGYKESSDNYSVAEDGSHKGYSRYGQLAGDVYVDWDAAFVNFCMTYAGMSDLGIFPNKTDAMEWYEEFNKIHEQNAEYLACLVSPGGYTPKAGDIVFLQKENEETEYQMGIVSSYDKEKDELKLIEGNSGNEVKENTYKIEEKDSADAVQAFAYLDVTEAEKVYKKVQEQPKQPTTDEAVNDNSKEEAENDSQSSEEETEISVSDEKEDEEIEVGIVRILNCNKDEHEHSNDCYDENGELICELDEHTHINECYDEISKEDWERVNRVIKMIDELPTYEEIGEKLGEYDEAEDEEGYEEYYKEIAFQAEIVYRHYESLEEELKGYVKNSEKLLQLTWLWEAMTLYNKESKPPYTVAAINTFGTNGLASLVYGDNKTIYQASGSNSWYWWVGCIVEKRADGNYVIKSQFEKNKGENITIPSGGFALLFHENYTNLSSVKTYLKPGNYVTVNFDYKSYSGKVDSNGFGTVNINSTPLEQVPQAKAKTVRNNNLTPFKGVSTKDLIEINLYDFGTGINNKWNSNKKYPGFQNPGGTKIDSTKTSLTNNDFNFGDTITSNLTDGISAVTTTSSAGTINEVHQHANEPISTKNPVVQPTLGEDGYPALADGTSLGYLFGGGDNSVTQINRPGLDRLFQYDKSTGEYEFNSRENHAQYNSETNEFDLYNQIISSNYLMYPFGNFLPFNDIQQAVQASSVNRQYFLDIAASAKDKYGKETNPTFKNAYNVLANSLTGFVNGMDTIKGNKNWTGKDAVDQYFIKAHASDSNLPTTGVPLDILNKVYSIDYDDATNFYFGMSMDMDLLQPRDGLTGPNNNSPMVFYFTGDDDVWVYVDGELYLDLSGIHRHVGGKIDFQEGEVYYYRLDTSKGYINFEGDKPIKTVTFEEIIRNASKGKTAAEITSILDATLKKENGKYTTFKDNSAHNFKFYYMERGSGSGVCRMNFNFPLLEKNSVTVGKELSVDNDEVRDLLGNPSYQFQVLEAKRDGTKPTLAEETLFIDAGTPYDIYEKELVCENQEHRHTDNCYQLQCNEKHAHTGKCYLKDTGKDGTVGEYGIISLKVGQYAVFPEISVVNNGYYVRELFDTSEAEQYGTVTSTGTATTVRNGIEIDSKTFVGVESNVCRMLDGSTFFEFDNTVKTEVLGSIRLTKEVDKSADNTVLDDTEFEFKVEFDGGPIKVGTKYTVTNKGEAEGTEKSVDKEGFIKIKANQTAEIKNILAGSKYSIQETEASSNGYTVLYSVTDTAGVTKSEIKTDSDGNQYVTGMISVQLKPNILNIKVNNTANGITLNIPVEKIVSNPDGTNRIYNFELQEVADSNGTPLDSNPSPIVLPIEINGQSGKGDKNFIIPYGAKNYSKGDTKHYYQIKEIVPNGEESDEMTVYDSTMYIVEVTVTKKSSTEIEAKVTDVWKYAKNVQDGSTQNILSSKVDISDGFKAEFTNRLLHDLAIAKIVDDYNNSIPDIKTKEFKFELTLTGENVKGSKFDAERRNISTGELISEDQIKFDGQGKVEITLKDNQYLYIKKLPFNATWSVVEKDCKGLNPSYIVSKELIGADIATQHENRTVGDQVTGNITDETDYITFVNLPFYELPSTGGVGIYWYMFGGVLLMLIASLITYRNKCKEVLRS